MDANPQKAQQVGEAFLIWLERLDDPYKSELLAKVFEQYVRGNIDFDRASRYATVIDRAHVPYLFMLRDGYLEDTVKSHLLALGLMDIQANWGEVEQQIERDVPSRDVRVIKMELNDDGWIFKQYVMEEARLPTRITERIKTPRKEKRSRGSQ